MVDIIRVHPQNPEARLIKQIAQKINAGAVIAFPTDSGYSLGVNLENKAGLERLIKLRNLDKKHNFTLICSDIQQISNFSILHDHAFHCLKNHTPGAYTFILDAAKNLPRFAQCKRKTIGVRIVDHPFVKAILAETTTPLLSCSLILDGIDPESYTIAPTDFEFLLKGMVDLIIDCGEVDNSYTSVVDLSGFKQQIVRQGKGDLSSF